MKNGSSTHPVGRTRRWPDQKGPGRRDAYTLAELMVAVTILGLGLFGLMSAMSFIGERNREASQRMLAASIGSEILELFKAQPFSQIANSTVAAPVYLKEVPGGGPDAKWRVPAFNSWASIPVEDVTPAVASAPATVPDKLPNGLWRADFVDDPLTPTLRQITVTLQWQPRAGANQRVVSLSTSTTVCQYFPSL
jgi:type II secretory pathway pseudopilin PulG